MTVPHTIDGWIWYNNELRLFEYIPDKNDEYPAIFLGGDLYDDDESGIWDEADYMYYKTIDDFCEGNPTSVAQYF